MFKNYIKTSFRNIRKHKGFSLINIIGLAIAMTVSLIILLWCRYELNYDRFLTNYDNLYRVNTEFHLSAETEHYEASPEPTGRTLVEMFPEITHHCHFYPTGGLMVYNDKKFSESNMVFTGPNFLTMFSVHPIQGNRDTMLDDPYSIVLTQSMAEKYFGVENPIGKVIRRNDSRDFTVTGVIEDFPENATHNFDFVMSTNLFHELELNMVGNWGNISGEAYIMTEPGTNMEELNQKIYSVPNDLTPDNEVCYLWLQPLSKIHLYNLEGGGAIQYIYIFMAIAVIVLVIACINFMNLSTARSSLRAKEVGMRKVTGAQKNQLIRQFFGESILTALIAMVLAIIFTEIIINSFDRFANIRVNTNFLYGIDIIPIILSITIFTSLFAGSYPAFFLSKFNPITVLKGVYSRGKKGNTFRTILVIVQFSLSIILITCTLVVFDQMSFMKEKDLGFTKDNILYLPLKGKLDEQFTEFKDELLKNPEILHITRSASRLTNIGYVASGLDWEGREEEDDPIFSFNGIDYDYFKTFDMDLIAGRGYSEDYADDEKNYILNETAIKRIGYEGDPIGRMFNMWGREGIIIGVVKDFNFMHQSKEIEPLILTYFPDYFNLIFIKTNTKDISALIAQIKSSWESFETRFPFEYHFMDEDFEQLYKLEENMGSLFQIFTALAVFISCLGLFGLATFVVEKRTKEIGVRKVLGASSRGLAMLLIMDFTKWVLLANVIAWPIAWYAMSKWLQNYAYRIDISFVSFILAGISALLIAILTVFFHSYRAANANPVKSLKYE